MIGNDHVGFRRGPSRKGPAQLAPRATAYLTLLAQDVWRLNRLQWVMLTSMLKTLAGKHGSSVTKMADKYQAVIDTPVGPRVCFQASVERAGRRPLVARFGAIPLKRQKKPVLHDRQPVPATGRRKGTELLSRLRKGWCELCEQRSEVRVHHVSKLADLVKPRTAAATVGATDGQDAAQDPDRVPSLPQHHPRPATCQNVHVVVAGEPDDRKRSSPVRAGGRWKRT